MDGVAFTLGAIRTLCFLAIGFLTATFFAWSKKQDEFLMDGGGDDRDSKEDENPLFYGSFQYESKLSHQSVVSDALPRIS